jgi:hypothetical protein
MPVAVKRLEGRVEGLHKVKSPFFRVDRLGESRNITYVIGPE